MSFFSKKKPKEPQNIDEILAQFKALRMSVDELRQKVKHLEKINISDLKKIGVVRFNPFNETGGNQSFSLAILDGNNRGVVVTSLFSRRENRVYGKPINNGISEYQLTDEEKQAITLAQNQANAKDQISDVKSNPNS